MAVATSTWFKAGFQLLNERAKDRWLIANAIIVVSIDDGK
jgi:hypothetical protein